jgi:GMP synthase-like glutamine amidotransferase
MPSALILQHVAVEGPGGVGAALRARGVALRTVRLFAGEPVPVHCDADALVVMGGPMGVYEQDRYPHLRDELRLIERTLRTELPVLGICLGSQLLAHALGARVYPNTSKEIGWYDVELTPGAGDDTLFAGLPRSFTPLHWHGDVFDLPTGAVPLARSRLTPQQAFRHGAAAYGVLFHLELDRPQLGSWLTAFAAELEAENIAPRSILADADRRLADAGAIGTRVFDRFAALLG